MYEDVFALQTDNVNSVSLLESIVILFVEFAFEINSIHIHKKQIDQNVVNTREYLQVVNVNYIPKFIALSIICSGDSIATRNLPLLSTYIINDKL